jgi:hypothetical protein
LDVANSILTDYLSYIHILAGSVANEWVEIFVNEMMASHNIDDARARTAKALEALKKSILDPAKAEAAPDISSDNHASL